MLSTNEKMPKVPPKTTTLHDYFKLVDVKKAADDKQGCHLKKRKSIANESIDLDRGRPSKGTLPRYQPYCQRTRPKAEGCNLVYISGCKDINCGSVGTTYQEQAYEPCCE
jgi:hypothetical protein